MMKTTLLAALLTLALAAPIATAYASPSQLPPPTAEMPDYLTVKEIRGDRLIFAQLRNARPWPKVLRVASDAKIDGLNPGESLSHALPARLEIRGLRTLPNGAAEITSLRVELRFEAWDFQD